MLQVEGAEQPWLAAALGEALCGHEQDTGTCVCVCVSVTHTPAHAYTCTHMRTHTLCDNVADITREGASTCHLSLCRSFQIWMSCVL